ncbi:hypothetical protein K438DRAFT_1768281 [Mycena galopus ATCC 62051]|nr:hypothetical protein K438DRAFT_1768281 [Mycena galopus ATCC 62051]
MADPGREIGTTCNIAEWENRIESSLAAFRKLVEALVGNILRDSDRPGRYLDVRVGWLSYPVMVVRYFFAIIFLTWLLEGQAKSDRWTYAGLLGRQPHYKKGTAFI